MSIRPVRWSKQRLHTTLARRSVGAVGSRIFLVHGRDFKAVLWMRERLAQLGMRTIEWDEAINLTGSGTPYVLDTVRAGMSAADATVVLFTGDEEVKLRPDLQSKGASIKGFQSRPNVWLEAGISLALDRRRTILVEYGNCLSASDLSGIHFLRYSEGGPIEDFVRMLAVRLQAAGCRANIKNIVLQRP